jgi:serine/threonine protein kinase
MSPESKPAIECRVSSILGDPIPAGSTVTLRTASNQTLPFEIIHPFIPFTKSQVYLVRPALEADKGRLPPEVILKIYDPRYLDDRLPPTPKSKRPIRYWSLEAETQAAERRKRVESSSAPDDFDEDLLYEDVVEPWLYEEHFYRLLKVCWESEVACLRKLEGFQGTVVPRLFESGSTVILPPATRAIEPFAVVMEYIPGRTLQRLTPAEVNSIPPSVFRPLVDAVSKFVENGAVHNDISANNILLSPVECPTRAVLIDFGCGAVREDYETEEEWEFSSDFASDLEHLKITLRQKGIQVE